jgi:transcriptional regulator with XRE-family HTH domain
VHRATSPRPTQHPLVVILPLRSIRLREIHHLSQSQAAAKLGIARSTLSRIEHELVNVTWRVLGSFCETYDVTPDDLLGFDRFPPAPGRCLKCGASDTQKQHTTRDCIMSMEGFGRGFAYIAKEFNLTVRSIEFIIREEYQIRGRRAISAERAC